MLETKTVKRSVPRRRGSEILEISATATGYKSNNKRAISTVAARGAGRDSARRLRAR